MEEFKSQQVGSGGMALKGSKKKKKSNGHAGATRGNCWNCGKKGHWVKDCWEPRGDKEGQAPKWWKSQDKAQQTQDKSNNNDFAFTCIDMTISTSDWLANSVATTHIARNRSHFIDYIIKPKEIDGIVLGMPLKILGWGTINIQFLAENKIHLAQLQDVQHAPTAHNNLISIRQLTDHSYQAIFRNGGVKFQALQGWTFVEGHKVK